MEITTQDIINMVTESVKKILSEGISTITYHFTSLYGCTKILSKNAFFLTLSSNNADAYDNKRLFYLSTQRGRNKQLGYAGHLGSCARIQLDGSIVMNNFKGKPLDYWGDSMGKQSYYRDNAKSIYGSGFNQARKTHHNFEMEDRIFSYSPVIENAVKYIKRIDVFIDPRTDRLVTTQVQKYVDEINQKISDEKIEVSTIFALCSRYKIPIYIYNSEKDFNFMTDNTINTEIEDIYKNSYKIKQEKDYTDYEGYKISKELSKDTTKATILYKLFNILTSGRICREQKYYILVSNLLKKYDLEKYKNLVFQNFRSFGESPRESCYLLSNTMNAPIRKLNTEHGDDDSNKIMKFGADVLRKYKVNNFNDLARLF